MVSARLQELQALQSQSQTSRQQAIAQQQALIAARTDASKQASLLEATKTKILIPGKRPLPTSIESKPAYTRQRRESERVFLKQYPQDVKKIQEFIASSNMNENEIKSYLNQLSSQDAELAKAVNNQVNYDKVMKVLQSKDERAYFALNYDQRKLYAEIRSEQRDNLEALKKQYPAVEFVVNKLTLDIIGVNADLGAGKQSFSSIAKYNEALKTQSEKVRTEVETYYQQSIPVITPELVVGMRSGPLRNILPPTGTQVLAQFKSTIPNVSTTITTAQPQLLPGTSSQTLVSSKTNWFTNLYGNIDKGVFGGHLPGGVKPVEHKKKEIKYSTYNGVPYVSANTQAVEVGTGRIAVDYGLNTRNANLVDHYIITTPDGKKLDMGVYDSSKYKPKQTIVTAGISGATFNLTPSSQWIANTYTNVDKFLGGYLPGGVKPKKSIFNLLSPMIPDKSDFVRLKEDVVRIPTRVVSEVNVFTNKMTDKSVSTKELPYITRGTEITTSEMPISAWQPKKTDIAGLTSINAINANSGITLPLSSALYESSLIERGASTVNIAIKNYPAIVFVKKIVNNFMPDKKAEIEKQTAEVNEKIMYESRIAFIAGERIVQQGYDAAMELIKPITSKIYSNQQEVDAANAMIDKIIANFDKYQKEITADVNNKFTARQKQIIEDAIAKQLDPRSIKWAKYMSKLIGEGLTLKEAEKHLNEHQASLRAQGATEAGIKKMMAGEIFYIKLQLQWAGALVPIRERPFETLKPLIIAGAAGAAIAGGITLFPAAAPFIKVGLGAMLIPSITMSALDIAATPTVFRGEKYFNLTSSLVAGAIGAKLGGYAASRIMGPIPQGPPKFKYSKIKEIGNLTNKQTLEIKTASTPGEFAMFENVRASGGRIYSASVTNIKTNEIIRWLFLEVARFRRKTTLVEGSGRELYGFAYNSKHELVAKTFATVVEGKHPIQEITLMLQDVVVSSNITSKIPKTGTFVRRTLTGTTFKVELFRGTELISRAIDKTIGTELIKAKVTYGNAAHPQTKVVEVWQNIKSIWEVGVNTLLRRKVFEVKGQANMDRIWNDLITKYRARISRLNIPKNAEKNMIRMIPKGRESTVMLEYSTSAMYGQKSTTIRKSFTIPTDAHLTNLLRLGKNSVVYSQGKTTKVFEIGEILTPEQFRNLFITFSKIKTRSMKSMNLVADKLTPSEFSSIRAAFNALKIKLTLSNLKEMIRTFRKKEIIIYNDKVLSDIKQLQSIYAGQGTYELTESAAMNVLEPQMLSQFLTYRPGIDVRPVMGLSGQIIRTKTGSLFATPQAVFQPTSNLSLLSGLLVTSQISPQMLTQQQTISLTQQQLQHDKLILKEAPGQPVPNQKNRMSQQLIQTQAVVQTTIPKQKIITRRPPPPPPSFTRFPFLMPEFPSRKEQFIARKQLKKIKKKKSKYRRFPTETQLAFHLVAPRIRKPLYKLTGFEIVR